MSYLPTPKSRTSQVRERYRKARRRQLALICVAVCAAILLIALVIGAVLFLRSCIGGVSQPRQSAPVSQLKLPKLVGSMKLKSVWFVGFDDQGVYSASDTQRRDSGYPNSPVDQLAAYPLTGGSAIWEAQLDAEVFMFNVSHGQLLCFSQFLTEPPRAELRTYGTLDGAQGWLQSVEQATHAGVCVDGKVAVLGYLQTDGGRLCAYNVERGGKVWGMKVPLKGLSRDQLANDPAAHFELTGFGGQSVYQLQNIVGVIESETGKLVREYAAPGLVRQVQYDPDSGTLYALISGSEAGACVLQAIPVPSGKAVNLLRFTSADESGALMLAQAGQLIVSYADKPTEGGAPASMLAAFNSGHSGAVFSQRIEGGIVADVAVLAGAPQEYLVAVNADMDDAGLPTGKARLLRLDTQTGTLNESEQLKRPVLYLVPFKQQCLVLLRGGELLCYDPRSAALRRFRRASLPLLEAWLSSDSQRLLIYAVPEKASSSQPFPEMQVMVFE